MNSQPYNIVGEEQRKWRAQLARWPWEKHVRGPGRALVPVTQPTLLSRVCFSSPFLLHCICLDLVPWAEKAMATHSNTLAWKIPWTEEPGRLQSMGSRRVRHDWETSLSLITFLIILMVSSLPCFSLLLLKVWGRQIVWCTLTSWYLVSLLSVSIIHVSDIFLVGFWSWGISFIMWDCRGWGWQAARTWVSVSREMVGFPAPIGWPGASQSICTQ